MPNATMAPAPRREVLLRPLVPRAGREAGILHPVDLVARLEPLRDGQRVLAVTFHAQRERLESLDEEERVERRDRRADVSLVLEAGLQDVLRGAERLGELREDRAVVARVGLGEVGEAPTARVVELPPVDDDPADRRAVTADELGRRVHDDVGAVLERAAQVGRGERAVDHERDVVLVRDRGHALEVEHVALRVPDALPVEGPRVRANRGAPGVEVVGVVDEADLHPELRERVVQLVVRAAVEGGRRHDVPSALGQVGERHELRGLPARGRQGADPALECRHPVLERRLRGVHDPRVDVAELLEPEQRRGVRGVAEDVAGGLVDRDGPRPRRRVGCRTRVHLLGLESPALGHVGSPRVRAASWA